MSLADGAAWERENPRICPKCGGHDPREWYFGSPLQKCLCPPVPK